MLQFDASIFGGELPVGLGVVGIAVVLPGGDFPYTSVLRGGLRDGISDDAEIGAVHGCVDNDRTVTTDLRMQIAEHG